MKKEKEPIHDIFYQINFTKATLKRLEKKRNNLILVDLQKVNTNQKYMYSYRTLAKKYGVSSSTIQKIAELNNLSRKSKNEI